MPKTINIYDESQAMDTYYDDLQVNLDAAKLPSSNYPADRLYAFGIAAGVEFPVLGFDIGEYIYFKMQTSHSMLINSALENHIHWTIPSNDTGAKIKFQLDVIAAGVHGAFAVPTGSPFSDEHTLVGDEADKHNLFSICEIPAVNTSVSSAYICKLTRIAATSDDYGSEVYVFFADSHYQKNSYGSRTEFTK